MTVAGLVIACQRCQGRCQVIALIENLKDSCSVDLHKMMTLTDTAGGNRSEKHFSDFIEGHCR